MTRLLTDSTGPGSKEEIETYIRTVLEQRTNMKPDTRDYVATTPEKLARAMRQSILSRLGFDDALNVNPEVYRVEDGHAYQKSPWPSMEGKCHLCGHPETMHLQ